MDKFELWSYFKRGYSAFLVLPLSVASNGVILYSLMFKEIIPSIYIFAALLGVPFIALAVLVGWWDYKRGSSLSEQKLIAEANPWVRDLAEYNLCICEAVKCSTRGDVEGAESAVKRGEELMARWRG